MLDIKLIIEKPQYVVDALKRKNWEFDPSELLALSEERKTVLQKTEANKAQQNKLSASVPQLKKEGKDVTEIFKTVKELAAQNKESELRLQEIEKRIHDILCVLPNLPDDDLLPGDKENNKVIKVINNYIS